jgi:hypothetical protein
MNNQEAKFILGAYRPDGQDAGNPMFAGALGQVEHDPELRIWFERERKFDTAVSQKIQTLAPPPELRGAILAGGRASRPRRRWWSNPLWMAAAAAIAIITTVSIIVPRSSGPAIADLASFALNDLNQAHGEHVGYPPGLSPLQTQLGETRTPLTTAGAIKIDLEELRRKKCRSIQLGGREVFEICFNRDGTWYHLFAASRAGFSPGDVDPKALIKSQGEFAVTAWADAKFVYALVAPGSEALRRLI